MILLLGAERDRTDYALVDKNIMVEQGFSREPEEVRKKILDLKMARAIDRVGYRVEGGGEPFSQTVTELAAPGEGSPGGRASLVTEGDLLMNVWIEFFRERLGDCRHFLVSDTAFFSSVPEHERMYAIPFEKSQQGIRKYGRNGILHRWAVQKYAELQDGPSRRVITVALGERTNIAAIRDGKPFAVSNGFSANDGILSRTGCGDIDTSLVFQMFSSGMSAGEIRAVLSEDSGFKALLGGVFDLGDVLARSDKKARWAQEIFAYQLLKYIGAYMAVLEGVSNLVFIGMACEEMRNWVGEFITQLGFLGLRVKEGGYDRKDPPMTSDGSSISVYYLAGDRWQAMADLIARRT